MRVAIFGGSFDPIHCEHVRLAEAAIEQLALDKLLVMPSRKAPHKQSGATAEGRDRFEMCKIAFSSLPKVEISDFELSREQTSYSYLTCQHFAEHYPEAERFFLVGADMLEDFFTWRLPEEILKRVTLVACGRAEPLPKELHERFIKRFSCDFLEMQHTGEELSSTEIRVALAFGREANGIPKGVQEYIKQRGLYLQKVIPTALALEKPERREHSFRVALMACKRAPQLKISPNKALFAAALHDCGKNVPLTSPLLADFSACDVPPPVLHQYVGAYLAEHEFQIQDEEILNAIRYHTSGRAGMSDLEKLIYLADGLETGRNFPKVEELRKLFWEDLDRCLCAFLKEQMIYLKSSGKPVYSLTQEAFAWISGLENKEN